MQAANNQLRVRTVEALDAIAAGQQQRTVLEDTNKIYISDDKNTEWTWFKKM